MRKVDEAITGEIPDSNNSVWKGTGQFGEFEIDLEKGKGITGYADFSNGGEATLLMAGMIGAVKKSGAYEGAKRT